MHKEKILVGESETVKEERTKLDNNILSLKKKKRKHRTEIYISTLTQTWLMLRDCLNKSGKVSTG